MATPDSTTFFAVLRVEGAADWHPELTRVLGGPDTCFTGSASEESGSLWAMESLRTNAGAEEPLQWAGDLIDTHETLLARLLADGGRVVVHLGCDCDGHQAVFRVAPRWLEPFARVNITVEFGTTFVGGPIP